MKKYIAIRLFRSLISIFVVISVVFTLIYTVIPKDRVFLSDTNIEKLQKRPDDFISYKNLQWERLGYIYYLTINDFCKERFDVATPDYNRCIMPNSKETTEFILIHEENGFNVEFFPDSKKAYATRDIPNMRRIFNWWSNLIQVDHPSRVQFTGENQEERGYFLGRDFNGNLALMCYGCESKHQIYVNQSFPFIHQNIFRLNLGISYPTYSGQEVLNVLTSRQGNKLKHEINLPNGEVAHTSLNLHTCRFKETLDHLEERMFADHYVDCAPLKDGPSMMQISFTIGIIVLFLSYAIGLPVGVQMAQHQGKTFDKLGQWYIIAMMAIPSLAYVVLVRFIGGKYLGLPTMFPLLGAEDFRSFILPIVSLTIGSVAGRMMWMRRYMIDQSSMDYVRFARAKGLTENEIFFKHIFKNAIGPIAHGLPTAIIFCISGAMITESVYSIPGMAKILPDSINIYNNSMVIAITFIFTTLAIFSRLLGDMLLTILDPRIALHEKRGKS